MNHGTHIAPATFSQLEKLPLCEGERMDSIGYLHDGQVLAELMLGALESLRSGVEFAERGIKAILPRHVRH